MIRTILTDPNPLLRKRSREIEIKTIAASHIKEAINDLKATLSKSEDGIGIAAPQVGLPIRIFIISEEAKHIESEGDKKKAWTQYVYINPVITKSSRKRVDGVEGCLSVPGKYGFVARPEKVSVEAYDENGKKFSHGASKFFARVIQHELDHLDGILFIDKVSRFIKISPKESKL